LLTSDFFIYNNDRAQVNRKSTVSENKIATSVVLDMRCQTGTLHSRESACCPAPTKDKNVITTLWNGLPTRRSGFPFLHLHFLKSSSALTTSYSSRYRVTSYRWSNKRKLDV